MKKHCIYSLICLLFCGIISSCTEDFAVKEEAELPMQHWVRITALYWLEQTGKRISRKLPILFMSLRISIAMRMKRISYLISRR